MREFLLGFRYGLPVMLAYFPVGFAYGLLAAKAGMHPVATAGMSLFVYAGLAQFIAIAMLMGGASIFSIVTVTFVVNLRHVIMSAALVPYVKNWSKKVQAWFAFELTDETFAMNLVRFQVKSDRQKESLGLNFFAHIAWVLSGVIGAFVGESAIDFSLFGFEFAFVGMFLALLIPWLREKPAFLATLSAGIISLLLADFFASSKMYIIIAAVIGATVATALPLHKEPVKKEGVHD